MKSLPKVSSHPATKRGEILGIDTSSVKHTSLGGKKFWLRIVDLFTKNKWSYFIKQNSDLPETVINLITHLKKTEGISVKVIRCENAG